MKVLERQIKVIFWKIEKLSAWTSVQCISKSKKWHFFVKMNKGPRYKWGKLLFFYTNLLLNYTFACLLWVGSRILKYCPSIKNFLVYKCYKYYYLIFIHRLWQWVLLKFIGCASGTAVTLNVLAPEIPHCCNFKAALVLNVRYLWYTYHLLSYTSRPYVGNASIAVRTQAPDSRGESSSSWDQATARVDKKSLFERSAF